nr:AncB [synthetic construct]
MSTPMSVKEAKKEFEANKRIYESALLTFKGVDGYDVYNCSVPFKYNGKTHIFGRVEKREEWANSHVRLFEETGKDEFTLVPDSMTWQLEDPFVSNIHGEMIFGGTHVRKNGNRVLSYYCDFYRGTPEDLSYFTTGPDYMKDIRLVELADGRIGVFSRPKTEAHAFIGFTVIDSLDELTAEVIEEAPPLNVLHAGAWGGVNQAYLLSSGKVGCISHYSYNDKDENGEEISVYVNYSFVLDPQTREVEDAKIIGTKGCYPDCPAKVPKLVDCAFSSGIVMREDGKCDLYSGLGDTHEGRITIDYPFEGYGTIVDNLHFLEHHHHHH